LSYSSRESSSTSDSDDDDRTPNWAALKESLSPETFAALSSHFDGTTTATEKSDNIYNEEFQRKASVLEDTLKRCRTLQTNAEEVHQMESSRLSELEAQASSRSVKEICSIMETEGVSIAYMYIKVFFSPHILETNNFLLLVFIYINRWFDSIVFFRQNCAKEH
jgi:hypothetical protein